MLKLPKCASSSMALLKMLWEPFYSQFMYQFISGSEQWSDSNISFAWIWTCLLLPLSSIKPSFFPSFNLIIRTDEFGFVVLIIRKTKENGFPFFFFIEIIMKSSLLHYFCEVINTMVPSIKEENLWEKHKENSWWMPVTAKHANISAAALLVNHFTKMFLCRW